MKVWAKLLNQPVLVGLAACALALFGLGAIVTLPVRSSPQLPPRYVDVSTAFPGASSGTVDSFVTLPLEGAFASISGVQYVTGTTQPGMSDVQAFLAPGASPNTVYAEVLAAANAARANMPSAVQPSAIQMVASDDGSTAFGLEVPFAHGLGAGVVTSYVLSNIVPRLETISGIGKVQLYSSTPALMVKIDPLRMQASGVTAAEISQSLTNAANVASAGTLYNNAASFPINTGGDLVSAKDFANMPLGAASNNALVRLGDIGQAGVSFPINASGSWWNGQPSVYVAIGLAPGGNILNVARQFHEQIKQIRRMLPPGVHLVLAGDQSVSVSRSLHDLALTLFITILLVAGITVASLGNFRAALAPLIAILLSLLGAALVMQICGQSLNLFTIIALVLAVGLVVDDAIVVVEDIFRRTAEGSNPHEAAASAITRLAPVLAAISSTLIVAFLPLGFLSGLTATLFRPFALVLIAALLFSLGVALGIVPTIAMWASRSYRHHEKEGVIDRLRDFYLRLLHKTIGHSVVVAGAVLGAVVLCAILARAAPHALDPAADGLEINVFASGPNGTSANYLNEQALQMQAVMRKVYPKKSFWAAAYAPAQAVFSGYSFETPDEAHEAVLKLSKALVAMPGVSAYVAQDNGLPGAGDLPVSINISGRTDYSRLLKIANKMQADAYASGLLDYVAVSAGEPQYQYELHINRLLAARLGLSEATIDNEISAAMSNGQLGQVTVRDNTLNVVLAMPEQMSPATLLSLPVRTNGGQLVPLSTVASLQGQELPNSLGSWQGLPSVNIQGQPASGVPLSKALAVLRKSFNAQDTRGLSFGYSGPSETYQQSNKQNARLFAFGLAGLFFLLAAQFRSLRDPFVVIASVPLASLGPLLLCLLGGATLNIVTEIALLTVWGLIARQGILFVQVAHEGRGMGFKAKEAALRAARLRFRPILMITLALLGGALPLLLATGPQATIRYDLGAILATGMSGGFILSLFAVPSLYCLVHGRRDEN